MLRKSLLDTRSPSNIRGRQSLGSPKTKSSIVSYGSPAPKTMTGRSPFKSPSHSHSQSQKSKRMLATTGKNAIVNQNVAAYVNRCTLMNVEPVLEFVVALSDCLTSCSLANTRPLITEKGMLCICDSLKDNDHIIQMDFSESFSSVGACRELGEALKLNFTIKEMDLSGNYITGDGATMLANSLVNNSTLEKLNLSGNSLENMGVASIADSLMANTSLLELNLARNGIKAQGIVALSAALKVNQSLKTVIVRFNEIGDTGAVSLGGMLEVNEFLEELDCGSNGIGNQGGCALAEGILKNPHSSLLKINLRANKLKDSAATSFASMLLSQHCAIRELYLGQNLIGPTGLCSVADALKENYVLEKLDLQGVRMGREGAIALADALRSNNVLISLIVDLDKEAMPESEIMILVAALKANTTLKEIQYGSPEKVDPKLKEAIETTLKVNQFVEKICDKANLGTTAFDGLNSSKKVNELADSVIKSDNNNIGKPDLAIGDLSSHEVQNLLVTLTEKMKNMQSQLHHRRNMGDIEAEGEGARGDYLDMNMTGTLGSRRDQTSNLNFDGLFETLRGNIGPHLDATDNAMRILWQRLSKLRNLSKDLEAKFKNETEKVEVDGEFVPSIKQFHAGVSEIQDSDFKNIYQEIARLASYLQDENALRNSLGVYNIPSFSRRGGESGIGGGGSGSFRFEVDNNNGDGDEEGETFSPLKGQRDTVIGSGGGGDGNQSTFSFSQRPSASSMPMPMPMQMPFNGQDIENIVRNEVSRVLRFELDSAPMTNKVASIVQERIQKLALIDDKKAHLEVRRAEDIKQKLDNQMDDFVREFSNKLDAEREQLSGRMHEERQDLQSTFHENESITCDRIKKLEKRLLSYEKVLIPRMKKLEQSQIESLEKSRNFSRTLFNESKNETKDLVSKVYQDMENANNISHDNQRLFSGNSLADIERSVGDLYSRMEILEEALMTEQETSLRALQAILDDDGDE